MKKAYLEDPERRKVLERLLRVWCLHPQLRLGQLFARSTAGVRLEYAFDDELLGLLESGLSKTTRRQLELDFPLRTGL